MKPELEKKLFDEYPKLFVQKDLPMSQTCMCWGVDTGDGWYWLIDNLCDAIQKYCDSRNEGVVIRNKEKGRRWWQGYWYGSWQPWKKSFWRALRNLWKRFRERNLLEEEWQIEAVQVKEKFGGLRFYISGGDDEVYGMISLAEHLSYKICEWCGTLKEVKVYSEGWTRTLCPNCNKNWKDGKRPE